MNIERGGVYLTTLDPVVGKEIAKTRPVVIVSNDKNNQFSGTITVLPITSSSLQRVYPFEIFLNCGTANLPKDSKIKADQIRTLDRSRIAKWIGKLDQWQMVEVEKAMKIHLGLL